MRAGTLQPYPGNGDKKDKHYPGNTIYRRLNQHTAYADDAIITGRSTGALFGTLEQFEGAA